mmetsp:Transcript_10509/g.64358  ORF Transcript_10509/g.64358 Transcript_10509/m.64358 type:complete len:320 (-) Transcript_10509:3694-4653(-)
MLSAEASSAICVGILDGSRNPAIHTTYRSLLRPSSLREPRYPLLRVVSTLVRSSRRCESDPHHFRRRRPLDVLSAGWTTDSDARGSVLPVSEETRKKGPSRSRALPLGNRTAESKHWGEKRGGNVASSRVSFPFLERGRRRKHRRGTIQKGVSSCGRGARGSLPFRSRRQTFVPRCSRGATETRASKQPRARSRRRNPRHLRVVRRRKPARARRRVPLSSRAAKAAREKERQTKTCGSLALRRATPRGAKGDKQGENAVDRHASSRDDACAKSQRVESFLFSPRPRGSSVRRYAGVGSIKSMILPQVHLRKPCYDFSFL